MHSEKRGPTSTPRGKSEDAATPSLGDLSLHAQQSVREVADAVAHGEEVTPQVRTDILTIAMIGRQLVLHLKAETRRGNVPPKL